MSDLVPLSYPGPNEIGGFNYVSMIGGRSMETLIRNVCEIPRRVKGDNSDIVINYGITNHSVPNSIFMVNRNIVINKLMQVHTMGHDLALPSSRTRDDFEYPVIIKPFRSIGGTGIREDDGQPLGDEEYYQFKFPKIREFRVHCFLWMDQPVTYIQEKVIEDKNQLTWNKKQGGKFRYAYQPAIGGKYEGTIGFGHRLRMADMSISALKKLRMDFGGIDIAMDKDENFKIFEVNSRMGLRERSLFTYKEAFTALRTLSIDEYKQKRGWE
jgi:hypothetical protein